MGYNICSSFLLGFPGPVVDERISSHAFFLPNHQPYSHGNRVAVTNRKYLKDTQTVPEKAINISDLPVDIQKLLSDHSYNGDVSIEQTITVDHAY